VRDFDIIVPSREKFQEMIHMQTNLFQYNINSYGGIKLSLDGNSVDIWCEELSHFIRNANKVTFAYNYKGNISLSNEN
jgi:hypothetical protein